MDMSMTEITWLGQMGLIVKTESTAVCIDYYASDDAGRLTPVPIAAGDIRGIDAFLGTHDHLDHIDHESWKVWAQTCPDARFIFPMAHKAAVLSDGVSPEKAVGLNDGESVRIGDITVRAIPCGMKACLAGSRLTDRSMSNCCQSTAVTRSVIAITASGT